jgi:hypothetical protein
MDGGPWQWLLDDEVDREAVIGTMAAAMYGPKKASPQLLQHKYGVD